MYRSKDEEGKVKDFADVLKYARDKGILEITSLTHGQLIDEKMAKKIVEAEPSWISFSLMDWMRNIMKLGHQQIN